MVTGLILAIGGSLAYLLKTSDGRQSMQNNVQKYTSTNQTTPENTISTDGTSAAGQYVTYTSSMIASTKGIKLLFFHAPWCPQCRALETDIMKQGVPDGVTIIKVDYDSHQELRQKYGVTLQTTIVRVNDQGELVSKFVAYDDPSLGSVVENLL